MSEFTKTFSFLVIFLYSIRGSPTRALNRNERKFTVLPRNLIPGKAMTAAMAEIIFKPVILVECTSLYEFSGVFSGAFFRRIWRAKTCHIFVSFFLVKNYYSFFCRIFLHNCILSVGVKEKQTFSYPIEVMFGK